MRKKPERNLAEIDELLDLKYNGLAKKVKKTSKFLEERGFNQVMRSEIQSNGGSLEQLAEIVDWVDYDYERAQDMTGVYLEQIAAQKIAQYPELSLLADKILDEQARIGDSQNAISEPTILGTLAAYAKPVMAAVCGALAFVSLTPSLVGAEEGHTCFDFDDFPEELEQLGFGYESVGDTYKLLIPSKEKPYISGDISFVKGIGCFTNIYYDNEKNTVYFETSEEGKGELRIDYENNKIYLTQSLGERSMTSTATYIPPSDSTESTEQIESCVIPSFILNLFTDTSTDEDPAQEAEKIKSPVEPEVPDETVYEQAPIEEKEEVMRLAEFKDLDEEESDQTGIKKEKLTTADRQRAESTNYTTEDFRKSQDSLNWDDYFKEHPPGWRKPIVIDGYLTTPAFGHSFYKPGDFESVLLNNFAVALELGVNQRRLSTSKHRAYAMIPELEGDYFTNGTYFDLNSEIPILDFLSLLGQASLENSTHFRGNVNSESISQRSIGLRYLIEPEPEILALDLNYVLLKNFMRINEPTLGNTTYVFPIDKNPYNKDPKDSLALIPDTKLWKLSEDARGLSTKVSLFRLPYIDEINVGYTRIEGSSVIDKPPLTRVYFENAQPEVLHGQNISRIQTVQHTLSGNVYLHYRRFIGKAYSRYYQKEMDYYLWLRFGFGLKADLIHHHNEKGDSAKTNVFTPTIEINNESRGPGGGLNIVCGAGPNFIDNSNRGFQAYCSLRLIYDGTNRPLHVKFDLE
ncbi:hypothetical protein ACFL0W_03355 [Nanoarchaeota archaeon]